jgi:hypothetical protein
MVLKITDSNLFKLLEIMQVNGTLEHKTGSDPSLIENSGLETKAGKIGKDFGFSRHATLKQRSSKD